jgi:hypothetical protein
MIVRPTGCPSAAASASPKLSKYDLAREAVGCMGVFGGNAVIGPSKAAVFRDLL